MIIVLTRLKFNQISELKLIVDDGRYVINSGSTVEKSDMYNLFSEREGALLPDIGVRIYTTKDFIKFKYYDSYKEDVCDHVGPAESIEEAEEIYVVIKQRIYDEFTIKMK